MCKILCILVFLSFYIQWVKKKGQLSLEYKDKEKSGWGDSKKKNESSFIGIEQQRNINVEDRERKEEER